MNETPIQITGNLTADPELRHTNGGRAVTSLRVAANPRRYDRNSGQWVDGQTNYFDVEVWAGPENLAESLSRGDRVIIFGNLRTQAWTPESADKSRTKLVVVAAEVGISLRYATAKPVKTARVEDAPDADEESF